MSEMEIDEPIGPYELEIANMGDIQYKTMGDGKNMMWYNYRIGMKKLRNDDYMTDYEPLFSLIQYNNETSNTKSIMEYFKSLPVPKGSTKMDNEKYSYVRRFGQFVFQKDVITNEIMIITMDCDDRYKDLNLFMDIKMTDIHRTSPESTLILQEYAIEIIKECNLLGAILKTIEKGDKMVMLFDFYYNRTGSIHFHKDKFYFESLYVTLTYENDNIMLGPDIIAYPNNPQLRARPDEELEVFRPLLPPYGRIGFNDMLFSHSSPFDKLPEKVTVCKEFIQLEPYLCQEVTLKASPYRMQGHDTTTRTFIRSWFQIVPSNKVIRAFEIKTERLSLQEFINKLSPSTNIGQINIYYEKPENVTKDFIKNLVVKINRKIVNLGGGKRRKNRNTRRVKKQKLHRNTLRHKKSKNSRK